MAINKEKFADRLAENGGFSKKAAYKAVDAFIETVMDYLGEGEVVRLRNFGKFEMKATKERVGRNPKTGQPYIVPEHQKVKFTASGILADRIQERKDIQ